MTNTSVINNWAEAIGGGMEIHDGSKLATVSIAFSTVARNEAGRSIKPPDDSRAGGGIWNGGQVLIGNSILAENSDGHESGDARHAPDCYSPEKHRFTSMRGSVVGVLNANCVMLDTTWGDDRGFSYGVEASPLDPGFSTEAAGPGMRRGLPLADSSIAIGHGTGITSSTFFDCPEHDGFDGPRPIGGSCDAGALESNFVPDLGFKTTPKSGAGDGDPRTEFSIMATTRG